MVLDACGTWHLERNHPTYYLSHFNFLRSLCQGRDRERQRRGERETDLKKERKREETSEKGRERGNDR